MSEDNSSSHKVANFGPEGNKNRNGKSGQEGKQWDGYVIPRGTADKNDDTPLNSDDDGDFSDPYEGDHDDNDHDNNDSRGSESEDQISDHEVEDVGSASEEEGPTRFDPLSDKKSYKLDHSKEKYASKYFNRHVAEEMIQSSILQQAPVPANTFLTPPNVDDYIEDLVNDQKAMRFLRMHDACLRYVQKRIVQCMGSIAKIWHELDACNEGSTKSTMDFYDVKELMEKSILLLGQTNVACLYERRLNFLAKIMQSTKKAKQALRENEKEFKGGSRLFGASFYSVLDRKPKAKKELRKCPET